MLCNRPGRWKAHVTEAALSDENGKATLVARYKIAEEFRDGAWHDVSSEDMDITGYHYLEKNDGALNEFQIKAVKAAFGWNGDPATIDTCPVGQACRITTESSEYQGKSRISIGFLNHIDDEGGGLPKADEATRRALVSKLGPKLRAIGGNTGAQRPLPARAAANVAPKPAAPPAPVATQWDEASAWTEFVALCEKAGNKDAALQGKFFWEIMTAVLNTNAPTTQEQWCAFIDACAGWNLKDGTPF